MYAVLIQEIYFRFISSPPQNSNYSVVQEIGAKCCCRLMWGIPSGHILIIVHAAADYLTRNINNKIVEQEQSTNRNIKRIIIIIIIKFYAVLSKRSSCSPLPGRTHGFCSVLAADTASRDAVHRPSIDWVQE